jgi:hypothetical protein
MHTFVDGYNVTKGDPATAGLSIEEQRVGLVRRLRARKDALIGAGSVTVVFDGQHGVVGSIDAGAIDVRFSGGEPADEVLLRMMSRRPGPLTLVTSDGELRERVRAVAAAEVTFRDRSELYDGARPAHRKTRKRDGIDRDAGLPKGANKITQELKDIWLDEPEDT